MTIEDEAKTIAELEQETASLNEQTKAIKEEAASLEPQIRANLLNEFDEAMEQITVASDDYRMQELRFVHAFSQMRDALRNHLLSLRIECDQIKGEKQ